MPKTKLEPKEIAVKAEKILAKEFPDPQTPLTHKNAYELLIAAMLSAQTTDVTTNKVTPALFQKYPDMQSLAKAEYKEVDKLVSHINYHRTKAKNIIQTAKILVENYQGKVPSKMDELLELPGIGRKIANVVISEWFVRHDKNIKPEGFVVDTHVKRVSYRLGLTKNTDPAKIEKDLMEIYPRDKWVDTSLRLIFHGRKTCKAKPLCDICPLKDFCSKVGVTDLKKKK